MCFIRFVCIIKVLTYISLWKAFTNFIEALEISESEKCILSSTQTTSELIALWIHNKCEKRDETNSVTASCQDYIFSHALKMKAAVDYNYARYNDTDAEKWHNDEKENYSENPALSHVISRYMISLQRRKIWKLFI